MNASPTPGRALDGRTRLILTTWGWVYLALGPAFVAFYLLAKLSILPLCLWAAFGLVHNVAARWNLAGLKVELATATPRGFQGQPVHGTLCLQRRRLFGTPRRVDCLLRTHPERQTIWLRADGSNGSPEAPLTFACHPSTFGRFTVELVRVESAAPFALWRLSRTPLLAPEVSVIVWPKRRLRRLAQLEIDSRGQARRHASSLSLPEPGLEIRPYAPGDAPREVCWKSSARLGSLHVRPRPARALRPRTLWIQPDRNLWRQSQDFWSMVALASDLIQTHGPDGTLHRLQIGEFGFSLRSKRARVAALDHLALLRPTRTRPKPRPTGLGPSLELVPLPTGGVAVRREDGREVFRTHG